MSKTKKLFRLFITYKGENEKTAAIEKKKLELLVQANSYTEVEAFYTKLVKHEDYDKYCEPSYKIVDTEMELFDIVYNETLCNDNTVVLGLTQLYFEGEFDGLFNIKVRVYDYSTEKAKSSLLTYLVPGTSLNKANDFLKKKLLKTMKVDEFKFENTKLDKAEYIYVNPLDLIQMQKDEL